jgi:hypothetical protein
MLTASAKNVNHFWRDKHMLTLDLPVEPYWLALPRGVRVEIRPVTTAVMAAAQAGSARRLGALRAASEDLDPDMARGLGSVRQGGGKCWWA